MTEESCYLVKDVDDIVRMAGSDTEYRIVAIEDGLAWVKHTNTGQSNLEPMDKLIFVRGGGQERDFTDIIPHLVVPEGLEYLDFSPGCVVLRPEYEMPSVPFPDTEYFFPVDD